MKQFRKGLDADVALTLLDESLRAAARRRQSRRFLAGLLTPSEQQMMAQRLWVAMRLIAGQSYRGIRDQTGASLQTIVKVDRWLRRENPRYRRLFPIRHRRHIQSRRGFSDTFQPLPGSIKDLYRSLTGTALW